ncbi:MAG: hypothetical protein CFE34_09210 [Rhodobacteraceae bacterium PARR1]|nr:MAG: hypothetical protein CFE34_09210 [Rhodobacteraceae bacterium PARR1]
MPPHNLRGDMNTSAAPSPLPTALPGQPLDGATWDAMIQTAGPQEALWLVRQIASDLDRMQSGLRAALADGDRNAIRRISHALAGLGGTIGASVLHGAALDLNAAGYQGDKPFVAAQGGAVLSALAAVMTQVSDHLRLAGGR